VKFAIRTLCLAGLLGLLSTCTGRPTPARRGAEPDDTPTIVVDAAAPDRAPAMVATLDSSAPDRPSPRDRAEPLAADAAATVGSVPADAMAPRETAPPPPDADAAVAGAGMVIIAAGDIAGSGGSHAQTAQLVTTLTKAKPVAAILTLGDHAYDSNTTAEFARYFAPTWGVPALLELIHPAPGNHEYQTKNAQGYFDYFNGAGQATGRAGDRTKGYYSFDIGAWHLLALNSNDECGVIACDAGSAQVAWIKDELAKNKDRCTLAYMHHPRFNEGMGHADTAAMKDVWNALYDGGADVALAGHEHNFQQFAPMNKTGALDRDHGVRSFVVGTGGIDFYEGFNTNHKAAEEFKQDNKYGVLELTLDAGSYQWRFVAVGGAVLVSGSDRCR
jgi:hypothetical protein